MIFNTLKETAKTFMQAHVYSGTSDLVWGLDASSWYLVNSLSVPITRYPCVFIVVPRYDESYHSVLCIPEG